MTFGRLLLRNLAFHGLAHTAVLLGAALGTAVLTGALLVGDSLVGSLRERADQQRAGVEYALVSGRFFAAAPSQEAGRSQAGIILRGSISAGEGQSAHHLNNVTILSGFELSEFASSGIAVADTAAIPAHLAEQLSVKIGEPITIRIPIPATVPSESLLGQRDPAQTSMELSCNIQKILPDNDPASLFQLYPGFSAPRNVFIPRGLIQEKLDRIFPQSENDARQRHNSILAAGPIEPVRDSLYKNLRMSDWDLKWGEHPLLAADEAQAARTRTRNIAPKLASVIDSDHDGTFSASEIRTWRDQFGYLSLESRRGILEATTAVAALAAADDAHSRAAPTLIYLANSIASGDRSIPYSIVAALDPTLAPPLGPFLPPGVERLNDDEIVLTDWADSPLLNLPVGSPITVTYFRPELKDGRFVEAQSTFKLRGYLPLTGRALDPYLTPQFAGVTDRLSMRDWNPPFPYDNTKMGPRDEKYWREYRTIPKAYVNLAAGRRIWASRYGDTTSVRIAPPPKSAWTTTRDSFEHVLQANLNPASIGFVFDDLTSRFDEASRSGGDFSVLFLGFSFFLIVSALLLVGLMVRLNLERRASEIGILLATGWRIQKIRQLLLLEGLVAVGIGGIVGVAAAVGYAAAMLALLRWLWPDPSVGNLLAPHVSMMSLAIGYAAMLLMGFAAIWWSLRWLAKVPAAALIAGSTDVSSGISGRRPIRAIVLIPVIVILLGTGIAALIGGSQIGNPEMRAMTFFSGGSLLLIGLIMIAWRWLKRPSHGSLAGHGSPALARLGSRNARRNPGRSILTAGLLASAAFLLVAVESFRRQPEHDFDQKTGGSGGCPILVETTLPVFKDLNSDGREDVLTELQIYYQRHPENGVSPDESVRRAREQLANAMIYSFRKSSGDDASCLNLYQAERPQILGAPARLIEDGGFQFVESEAETPEEKANPWLLLNRKFENGAIPVIGEENSLTWRLKKGLGDEWSVPDDTGTPRMLRVVGVLKDSVFQSELIASASGLSQLYPHTEGFTFHLVRTDPAHADAVSSILRIGLARNEPEITHSIDRVAVYMAVENSYLTTFQLLGGLGLILGAVGLAVVMLRGIWERRSELALFRALGYRDRDIRITVLTENALLLILGLAIGILAATLSVLPHVAEGGSIPVVRLSELLLLVLASGLLAGWFAIRSALRVPLLPALRRE